VTEVDSSGKEYVVAGCIGLLPRSLESIPCFDVCAEEAIRRIKFEAMVMGKLLLLMSHRSLHLPENDELHPIFKIA
jgi:hypothetical protein